MRSLTLLLFGIALVGANPQSALSADFLDRYGSWTKHEVNGTTYYQCKYKYKKKNGGDGLQYCIWFPNNAQRKHFYYWTKNGTDYWGKCIRPGAPGYNPAKMQWYNFRKVNNGDTTIIITITLQLGDCPAPGDANEDDGILKIPPPPDI